MRNAILAILLLVVCASGASAQLYVNEVMSSNTVTITDEDGTYSDWFELYNSGPGAVDLDGYYVTDTPANPTQWRFPSRTIPAGDFLLVWASGKNRTGPVLHTNFAIKAGGEPVQLIAPDGTTIVDATPSVAIPADTTYGRNPDGGALGFLAAPTPGATNVIPLPPLAIQFSRPAGFSDDPFQLTITANRNATIHYTIDGQVPDGTSPVYSGPINVVDRSGEPDVLSLNSNTSPSWTMPDGTSRKGTVIRAYATDGNETTKIATATYFVDVDYTVPVISVSTDLEHFFDYDTGIYVKGRIWDENLNWSGTTTFHPANYQMDDWERPVHVEFFETNGTRVVDQDIGIQISGQGSRERQQKSLRLYARGDYGKSSISYPLFPEETLTSYKRVTMRNPDDDERTTFLRDVLAQEMVDGTSLGSEEYRPVVVFLNGEYWGLYTLREKANQHYFASHYGADSDTVVILEDNMVIDNGQPGDEQHYLDLLEYVRTHDTTDPAVYGEIQTRMDTESFARYYALETFIANTDWPDRNVEFWRNPVEYDPSAPYGLDGRWRWVLHDADWAFGYAPGITASYDMFTHLDGETWGSALWQGLRRNEEFRDEFITISADQMMTNFSSQRVISTIDTLADGIRPEVQESVDRWNHVPGDTATWEQNLDDLRAFAEQRPIEHRADIVQAFGLAGTATVRIETTTGGRVRVNTITPGAYPWEGTYFQDVPVTFTAIPEPGYAFVGWEEAATGTNWNVTIVPQGSVTVRAHFAPSGGAPTLGDGKDVWLSRKWPATNVKVKEPDDVTFAIGLGNPNSVPVSITWRVNGNVVASGATSYTMPVDYNSAGAYAVTAQVSGGDSGFTVTWNVVVDDAQPTTCYDSVSAIPATCDGGTITSDTTNGCRTIACSGAGGSVTAMACGKPNAANPTYFEMYKQGGSGTPPRICLGSACISDNGFTQANLPVCVANGTAPPPPPGNTTNTTGNTTTTCSSTIATMPVSCTGGSMASDTTAGSCRTLVCTGGAGTKQVLGCNKPDTGGWQYFELYNQGGPGSISICVGTTCIASGGYAKSPNFPICTAGGGNQTNTTQDISFSSTTPASASVTIAEPNSQAFSYVLSNPSGLPTTTTWRVNNVLQANTGTSHTFNGGYDTQGVYNVSVRVASSANTIQRDWTLTVTDTAQSNQTCYSSVSAIPATCDGGSITSDVGGGCRTIVCQNGGQNLQVLACNKPGNYAPQYFEMYKQSGSGTLRICLGSTCIQDNGYAKSANFPICSGGSPPGDTTPPVISNGQPTGTLPAGTASTTLGVTTNEAAECRYSLTDQAWSGMTSFAVSGGTTHTTPITGLVDGQSRTYYVRCRDTAGNANTASATVSFSVGTSGTPTASVAIAPWFPQGRNYVFLCAATGFTPTSYDWTFGDGQNNNGRTSNDVYHTYGSAGNYTVTCTAKNGGQTAVGNMPVMVS